MLTATGAFRAEVVPEEADGEWRTLAGPEELVEFYDPTDVFGDLADALAEAFPAVSRRTTRTAAAADAADEDAARRDADEDGATTATPTARR